MWSRTAPTPPAKCRRRDANAVTPPPMPPLPQHPPARPERRDAPAEPGAAALANPTFPTASSPDAGDAESEALFAIDESSDLPLWVQLRNRLAHLIRTGYFKAGEQLPSLRSLSAEARVNYNTVTKAYRDLESSNLIVSVRGRGMYVQKNVTVDDSPENAVDAMAEQCVEEYRALGLTYRDIQRRLTDIVQTLADKAAAAADEKRDYYGKTH